MHFIFMSECSRLRKRQERKGAGKMSRRKNEGKEGSQAIAKAILEEYQPTTVEEMQEALREIFGPMFEALLQGEMDAHLGYKSNDRGAKDSSNRRNGYTDKMVKSSMGDIKIRTPRDRDGSFEPQIVAKRTRGRRCSVYQYGWGIGFGGGRKVHFQRCCCPALHRSLDP